MRIDLPGRERDSYYGEVPSKRDKDPSPNSCRVNCFVIHCTILSHSMSQIHCWLNWHREQIEFSGETRKLQGEAQGKVHSLESC
jgi:hypothetical protein